MKTVTYTLPEALYALLKKAYEGGSENSSFDYMNETISLTVSFEEWAEKNGIKKKNKPSCPNREILVGLNNPIKKKKMKNSVLSFTPNPNNFNGKHRKENHFHTGYKVITFNPITKEFNTPLDCRIYDTPNRSYCAIWASYKVERWFNISATAYAGGYGYDRFSSAVGHAIKGMGINLEWAIEGVGSSATEGALLAVAKFVCNDETLSYHIVKCNG